MIDTVKIIDAYAGSFDPVELQMVRLAEALDEARADLSGRDAVIEDVTAERDDAEARVVAHTTQVEHCQGALLTAGEALDILRDQVAAVRALCESGVFNVREWGERGSPFSNGGEQAFRRVSKALAGPVPAVPPVCVDHRESQHRDNRPPWCDLCGWNHGRPAVPACRVYGLSGGVA